MGSFATRVVATIVVALDGTGDTADIQEGIDLLPAGGGVVYIKEGVYIITVPLEILSSNVRLEGAGASTIIYLDDGSDCNVLEIGDGATTINYAIVSNFRIDGNSAAQAAGHGIVLHGSGANPVSHCWIDTVIIDDVFGVGIYVDEANDVRISNCVIDGCGSHGIYANYGSLKVFNNTILSSGASGIKIELAAGIENYELLNNNIRLSQDDGIYFENIIGSTVIGNICFNNGQSAVGSGIHLAGDCDHNNISHNICYGFFILPKQEWGILIDAGNDDNIVLGNTNYNNDTGSISDGGANNEIGHNQ